MPRLLFLFSLVNLVIGSGAFALTGIPALIAQGPGLERAWPPARR